MTDNYAAVIVTLLNRDDGSEKKYYMYPATRIEFQSIDAQPREAFVVENGEWIPVKGEK
jgi:hypothetical protein